MLRLQKFALLLAAVFFVAANCDETDGLDSSLAVPFKVVDYFFSSLFKNLHDSEPQGLEADESTEPSTTRMSTTAKASSTEANVRHHARHKLKHHSVKRHNRIVTPINSTEYVQPRKHIN